MVLQMGLPVWHPRQQLAAGGQNGELLVLVKIYAGARI